MNTLFLGQHIIRLNKVNSTNNYTSELSRQNVIHEGTIVIADEQFSGKGQRGNSWISEPNKNLTFSVFIKPTFLQINNQFVLTKWISVSLVEVLKLCGIDAYIKWPNDIYVKQKKIAGILIENSVSKMINHSIIGIGLNVNQKEFKNLPIATSMIAEISSTTELKKLLNEICEKLEQNYFRLKSDTNVFDKDYLSKLMFLGKKTKFKDNKGVFEGEIIGVSPSGQLRIKCQDYVKEFAFKEVEFQINS